MKFRKLLVCLFVLALSALGCVTAAYAALPAQAETFNQTYGGVHGGKIKVIAFATMSNMEDSNVDEYGICIYDEEGIQYTYYKSLTSSAKYGIAINADTIPDGNYYAAAYVKYKDGRTTQMDTENKVAFTRDMSSIVNTSATVEDKIVAVNTEVSIPVLSLNGQDGVTGITNNYYYDSADHAENTVSFATVGERTVVSQLLYNGKVIASKSMKITVITAADLEQYNLKEDYVEAKPDTINTFNPINKGPSTFCGYSNDTDVGLAYKVTITTGDYHRLRIAENVDGTVYKKIGFDLYYCNPLQLTLQIEAGETNGYLISSAMDSPISSPAVFYSNGVEGMQVRLINADSTYGDLVNASTDSDEAKNKWLHIEYKLPAETITGINIKYDGTGTSYVRNVKLYTDDSLAALYSSVKGASHFSTGANPTFVANATVGGRTAYKITPTVNWANPYHNSILLNTSASNDSVSEAESLNYKKVVFLLYAEKGTIPNLTLGLYMLEGESEYSWHYVNLQTGVNTANRVGLYDLSGNALRSLVYGQWIKVEFDLTEYRLRTASHYLRIYVGSDVVGKSLAVTDIRFSNAAVNATTVDVSGFTAIPSYNAREGQKERETYALTEYPEIGGKLADYKYETLSIAHGENPFQSALLLDPVSNDAADTNPRGATPGTIGTYKKIIFSLYASEGSNVALTLGLYQINHGDWSFHYVYLNELTTEGQTRCKMYNSEGEAITSLPKNQWVTVEFDITQYWLPEVTERVYYRVMVGSAVVNEYFVISDISYSSETL